MNVVNELRAMQERSDALRSQGKRIAVVPTMGALHDGHLSLIRLARSRADVVVTTLFVNPMQFAPNEDFNRYPRDLERDKDLAAKAGTDILFAPEAASMYPAGFVTSVDVDRLSARLEGAVRPGHFRGVTTVVAKLFNVVKPHAACFGQKDAQQVVVIRRMVQDLNFDVEIVVGPIVREADGLAMSSRNVYLSPNERVESAVLSRSLRHAASMAAAGERRADRIRSAMTAMISEQPSARIDYISVADPATLEEIETLAGDVLISLAVRFGATRLIDNVLLTV